MYVLIDTCNYEIDFQPTETIISCEYSSSLETLKNSLHQIIKEYKEIEIDDFPSDDLSTHTLRIFKIKDSTSIIFNQMTSQYHFSESPIIEDSYQSCDF
jgi:hypothetical protein